MIFQHTWKWLVEPSAETGNVKSRTCRIVKEGDALTEGGHRLFRCDHQVYAIGNTYAVQPGRGKPGIWWGAWGDGMKYPIHVRYAHEQGIEPSDAEAWGYRPLRIRVRTIHQEDVRDMSPEGVKAEGFASKEAFLRTWIEMHDRGASTRNGFLIENATLRPPHRYQAWVITFETA